MPVPESGWDNRTFRLGDALTARLPTAEWYVAAVAKEHTWLPRLAPQLPLPIPVPVALGSPGAGYPWPWSVRRWIDGRPPPTTASPTRWPSRATWPRFLVALWGVDAAGGPAAGAHSFHRGGALAVYDEETRAALATLGPQVDPAAARMWDDALAADVDRGAGLVPRRRRRGQPAGRRRGPAVRRDRLRHVGGRRPRLRPRDRLDAVRRPSRAAFVEGVGQDAATWARARGWALWKALITVAAPDAAPRHVAGARRTLARLLA